MMPASIDRRWSVAARVLAASVGGYGLTTLSIIALAQLATAAGLDRAGALLGAMMASFCIWVAVVLAVFQARSATRAWGWLLGAALPLSVIIWWLSGAHT